MLRKLLICSLFPSLLHSYHMVDVLGGTGFVWANFAGESAIFSTDKVETSTVDGVPMRKTIFFGIRYNNYMNLSGDIYILGVEVGATLAGATTNGKIKQNLVNSNGASKGSYVTDLDAAAAPDFNSYRALFHLSRNEPIFDRFAFEFGVFAGPVIGRANTSYQYSFSGTSGGSSGGPSGFGLHGGLRFGFQILPITAAAITIEYRLYGEFFGSYAWIPGLMSSGSYLTNTGHMFLLSVGYRFGLEAPAKQP